MRTQASEDHMNTATETAKPLLLLIDDDPSVLEALEAELGPRFEDLCRIETFRDAGEALEAVREWQAARRPIALAIVDQRMPGLTGLELIRRLNEEARSAAESGPGFHPAGSTRTVLLTGFGGPGLAAEAQAEPGVHRYREKPWRGDVLAEDVRHLLADYWRAARAARDPIVGTAAGTALGRLWDQLEHAALPGASRPATEAAGGPLRENEADDERLRTLLAGALGGGEGAWPSPEAVQAFLMGVASPDQLSEVRRAALGSSSFRREITYLVGQVGRLSRSEAHLEFDETRVPESLRRLLEPGDDDRPR